MILCDVQEMCPSPSEIAWVIEQSVDDSAHPDPLRVVTAATQPRSPATSRKDHGPASLPSGWAAGLWARFPASVETSALCIAHHESWGTHNGRRLWTALNLAGSSASGFAQWIDSTWRAQAKRAGVGTQYSRAVYAPAKVQAAVFAYQAQHHGLYPWAGTGCPGT